MHQQRLKPAVLFLSGCNYCMGGGFKQKYKVGAKIFSDVRVFISNGLSDAISTIAHAETVYEQMKKEGRVRNILLDKYEGGHAPSQESLKKASIGLMNLSTRNKSRSISKAVARWNGEKLITRVCFRFTSTHPRAFLLLLYPLRDPCFTSRKAWNSIPAS